ncbi:PREDICTED: RNA-binding protein 48 [Ceratosolen solmsi marchali]|uniref:RNA-binding protein 48 n=1 Tax=Ceratosolen solmsi marchali TaxID=326594 RepID=A0AAJ6YQV6_9HYME|nr:PREDICTED: RNA-binding protein 48 [Ceratosolen solmsi marchali]
MENKSIFQLDHHIQKNLCYTRPFYRQGRKFTAIKVYTINDESQHLIVCGVPKLNLFEELKEKFSLFGHIKKIIFIPEYPNEDFTESFHVHYKRIQSARISKRFLDSLNFFGGILHVFYAPELELQSETRQKIYQRQVDISYRTRKHKNDPTNPDIEPFISK